MEPGSPWENLFVEAFNSRVHHQLLNVELFTGLLVAQVVAEACRCTHVGAGRVPPALRGGLHCG